MTSTCKPQPRTALGRAVARAQALAAEYAALPIQSQALDDFDRLGEALVTAVAAALSTPRRVRGRK